MRSTLLSSRCTFFPLVQRYSRRVVQPSGRERATCGSPKQCFGPGGRIEGQSPRVSVRIRRCGQGLRFRLPGARVPVAECELLCALQACFRGVQAPRLKSTTLFFSTGNFHISILRLMKKLENSREKIRNSSIMWSETRMDRHGPDQRTELSSTYSVLRLKNTSSRLHPERRHRDRLSVDRDVRVRGYSGRFHLDGVDPDHFSRPMRGPPGKTSGCCQHLENCWPGTRPRIARFTRIR